MNALIIMTRIPIPYKTKTRLLDIFTGEECVKIHKCFLKDIYKVCEHIKKQVDVYLTYTPDDEYKVIEKEVPSYIKTFPQQGEDLGERMENAIGKLLNIGYEKVILIGSDIPEIQVEYILNAIKVLQGADVVIGPTLDGGYYLVGMKKLYKQIFKSKIKWGEKSVLDGTFSIMKEEQLIMGFASVCRDIDTKEDIKAFVKKYRNKAINETNLPINTIEFLKERWCNKYVDRSVM